MNPNRTPLSRAFFLELLLVFAIFTICAVICLQVFAAADKESDRSEAITVLGIKSESVAETYKATGPVAARLAADTGAALVDDQLYWYYDKDLNAVDHELAYFTLTCSIDNSVSPRRATIILFEGDAVLFQYDVAKYMRTGGA